MTIAEWLERAKADAVRRGLPDLVPVLEGLATSTTALRAADWNDDADGETPHDEPADDVLGGGPDRQSRPPS